mgnify:FL=1
MVVRIYCKRTNTCDPSTIQGHYLLYPAPATFAETNAHAAATPSPLPRALAELITIQYFTHTVLPNAPAQRMQELFLLRPQWVREELVPFIAPIATSAGSVESLLLKHGRNLRARWSPAHAQVLLHGAWSPHDVATAGAGAGAGTSPACAGSCTLYQARVKYS